MYSLAVRNNSVVIRLTASDSKPVTLTSAMDYVCFLLTAAEQNKCSVDDIVVMCSSSMDFPEDSTKNKDTIRLAHALRNDDLSHMVEAERKRMGSGKTLSKKHRQQLEILLKHLSGNLASLQKEIRQLELRSAGITAQIEGKLP